MAFTSTCFLTWYWTIDPRHEEVQPTGESNVVAGLQRQIKSFVKYTEDKKLKEGKK